MNIGIVLGSVRPDRMGERVGKLIFSNAQQRMHNPTIFDPFDYNLPMLRKPIHFHKMEEPVPVILSQIHEKLKQQDAFIIVTPEYNAVIPPALTNFIDHFPYDCFQMKAGSIVSYSMDSYGGVLAASQIRTMSQMIQLIALPNGLSIPNVQFQLDENGAFTGERWKTIENNMKKMFDELEYVGDALVAKNKLN